MSRREMPKPSCHEDSRIDLYLPILESIKAHLHLIDRDLRIQWANATGARCGSRVLTGIEGRHCYDIHLRRSSACPDCPVRRVFDSHMPQIVERWIPLPDGSQKCFEVRVYPVRDGSGKAVYAIKMGLDVTERKLAGEKHIHYVESLEMALKEGIQDKYPLWCDSRRKKNMFKLSEREIQVLRLLSEGLSNTEIAAHLAISPHTVKTHVTHLFNKIGVTDRTQAAVLAARLGII
jgi:DNA-binding CsgD family transcriptional regulator